MDFEILSDITEIKKIAIGSGVRDMAKLRRKYGRGRWRKLKASQLFACEMDVFGLPNYTGTKLMA